ARPDLDGRIEPHEERPLLRIPRQDAGGALVAETSDGEGPGGVVGSAHPSTPTLRATSTVERLAQQATEPLMPAEGGDRGRRGAPRAPQPAYAACAEHRRGAGRAGARGAHARRGRRPSPP